MKQVKLCAAVAMILALCACGGGGGGSTPTTETPPTDNGGNTGGDTGGDNSEGEGLVANPTITSTPVYNAMSVHDPSVVKTNGGDYYVFGSHLSAAKTNDLVSWSRVADLVTDANPLFDTYQTQAAEGIAWTDGWVGSWAADVIQLANGNYYFYYDHCAEDPDGNCISRSYLGVAKSASVEGPYENIQLILQTGQRAADGPGINGETYNGNFDPNAIDPDVFYDKEGRLWMVYGSYSGGIWIMEMDPDTGLALPDQGYGTKLTGGYYSAIEGPFILYSPDTDYYYLFTSFGGFAQNDGYNMRVARSRSPNGPYLDASGQDMIGASGGWDSITNYGSKIIGGFNFKAELGLSGRDYGYMAPGHGSAYYDETAGKYYLFFHTRFPTSGEYHEIRVHQIYMNAEGWPVVAPHRYAPISGDNIVDSEDIIGTYQFINHGHDINRVAKVSTYVSLNRDGTVSGTIDGTYTLDDSNNLTITTNANTYVGVATWQWNGNESALVPTFSVMSEAGISLWGSKVPFVDYNAAVTSILDSISFPAVVTEDITLPTEGILNATISWTSSNNTAISTTGAVTRPAVGESDATVTLTATVTLNDITEQRTYTVTVRAQTGDGLMAYYAFDDSLADSNNVFSDATLTGTSTSTNNGTTSYADGVQGKAFMLNGSTGIRFPTTLITSATYTVSYWVYPTAEITHTPTFFGAKDNDSWLSMVPQSWDGNTLLWSNDNGSWFDGATNEKIPLDQWSFITFTVNEGAVKVYLDGVEKFSGSGFPDLFSGNGGEFYFGINYWDPLFEGSIDELRIYDRALDATEVNDLFNN